MNHRSQAFFLSMVLLLMSTVAGFAQEPNTAQKLIEEVLMAGGEKVAPVIEPGSGCALVSLGSWTKPGGSYRDPLGSHQRPSDHDLRLVVPKGLNNAEALQFYNQTRARVAYGVRMRFGVNANRILESINIYPPEQLMAGVKTEAEAIERFAEHKIGTPNLGGLPPDGLWTKGRFEFARAYERTSGRIFFNDGKKMQSGFADIISDVVCGAEDAVPSTLSGASQNAAAFAEKAAHAVEAGRPEDAIKDLQRTRTSLGKGYGLAKVEGSASYLDDLISKAKKDPFPLLNPSLRDEILKATKRASLEAHLLEKIETASAADKELITQWLKELNGQTTVGQKIMNFFEKVPFDKIALGLRTIFTFYQGYVIAGKVDENDIDGALREAGVWVTFEGIGVGPGMMVMMANILIEQAKAFGFDLVASTQDCVDLLAGVFTVKGREVNVLDDKVRPLTVDDLVTMYQRPQDLEHEIDYRAHHAAARGLGEATGKSDIEVQKRLSERCKQEIIMQWSQKRNELDREFATLHNALSSSPISITYQPDPAVFAAEPTPYRLRATIALPMADIRQTEQKMEEILTKLAGKHQYAVMIHYVWKLDGMTLNGNFDRPEIDFVVNKVGPHSLYGEMKLSIASGLNYPRSWPDIRKFTTTTVDVSLASKENVVDVGWKPDTLSIVGPTSMAPGQRTTLSLELGENIKKLQNVQIRWFDVDANKLLGKGNSLVFSPGEERTYRIKVVVLAKRTKGEERIGEQNHRIVVAKPPACIYRYSEWGECHEETKKQTRTALGREPLGCIERDKPVLERDCSPEPTPRPVTGDTASPVTPPRKIQRGAGGSVSGMFPAEDFNGMQISYSASGCSFPKMTDKPGFGTYRNYEGRLGSGTMSVSGTARMGHGNGAELVVTVSAGGKTAEHKAYIKSGFPGFNSESFNLSVPIPDDATSGGFSIRMDGDYSSGGGWRGLGVSGSCTADGPEGVAPKGTEELKVVVTGPKDPIPAGQKKDITARVSGGRFPYGFAWSGADGKEEKAVFQSGKPGLHTVGLSVTDIDGKRAGGSVIVTVAPLKFELSGLPGQPVYGSTARLKARMSAPGSEGTRFRYLWQCSEPGIAFDPGESGNGETTITFGRMGVIQVWAQVLDDQDKSTISETEQKEAKVISPKFTVVFSPPDKKAYVGMEVRARISAQPEVPAKLIDYRWFDPASSNRIEYSENSGEIGFQIKDTKPQVLKALARVPFYGDEISAVDAAYTGSAYKVTVAEPRYMGPKPMIWKCDTQLGGRCPGLVEVGDREFAVHRDIFVKAEIAPAVDKSKLRYLWTITPEGCTGGGSISQEIRINCSSTGTYAAKVCIRDTNGTELGCGQQSVVVSVSQDDLNRAANAKAAHEKLAKAKSAAAAGKLDEAISLADEAIKLDPKNSEAQSLLNKWKSDKATILTQLEQTRKLIGESKFPEAQKALAVAKNLHGKYPPVLETEKLLNEKLTEYNKREKETSENTARAQKLKSQGDALEKQGKLHEAIAKYRESLKHVPDPKLEEHIKTLDAKLKVPAPSPNKGYQLYFDGRLVSGPDAAGYTLEQAKQNCNSNMQSKPGIAIRCLYNGKVFEERSARSTTIEWNTDRPGADYRKIDLPKADAELCRSACQQDAQCRAWTYVKPNTIRGPKPVCYLKNPVPQPIPHPHCVSGVKE